LLGLLGGLFIIPVAMKQYYLIFLPLISLFAAVGLVELARRLPFRWSFPVMVTFLILLELAPMTHLAQSFHKRNDAQLEALRYVMAHTNPQEQVMDGWRGLGVFRLHTFYYYFLHPEIRAMVPESAWQSLRADLESGRKRPQIIVMDENLDALGSWFRSWVEAHYEYEPEYNIFRRTEKEQPRIDANGRESNRTGGN